MARPAGRGSTALPQSPATAADLGLMTGAPPEAGQLVTSASWQEGPKNRWAFQHVSELVPSAVVSRGTGPVLPLASAPEDIAELPLEGIDSGSTVEDFGFPSTYVAYRSGSPVGHKGFPPLVVTARAP